MSDDKMPSVIDLASERIKRDAEAGAMAHARGEAWAFHEYEHRDDSVAIIDGCECPVSVVVDSDGGWGICMTVDHAEKSVADLSALIAGMKK